MAEIDTDLYGFNGYISDIISDRNGFFIHNDARHTTCNLTIKLLHITNITIPGITITWSTLYHEWPTYFILEIWKEGRNIDHTDLLRADSPETFVEWKITGYDEIRLKIFSWCEPYHRARVEAIYLGVKKKFDKSDIINYTASMFVDPLSAALPKSEITFTVKQLEGEYNPDNPRNTQKYLAERQQVLVRYGYKINGKIEWITGGTYYLSDWTTPQNGITATFTARDALEFMSDPYDCAETTGTLFDIATSALEQANLPYLSDESDRWILSEKLRDAEITPDMEIDMSHYSIAEVLQCCANAACCVFYQDREGHIRMEPLDMSEDNFTSYQINRFNSYAYADLKLSKELKSVNVNDGQAGFLNSYQGEIQPINNVFISDPQAKSVAEWAANYLKNRRSFSGSFRADPRLDPLDIVRISGKYAETMSVITTIKFSYNGAFRGSYEAGGLDYTLSDVVYSGEIFSGEETLWGANE